MAATEHLLDKINHLRNQIKQDEMQVFVHDLAIADADQSSGSKAVDEQLKAVADSTKQQKLIVQRRIAVRKPLLQSFEQELEDQKASPAV